MTNRSRYVCTLAVLAFIAAPAGIQAQDRIRISLPGATGETPVSTVIDGKRVQVGEIGLNGRTVLDLSRANIGKGTHVDVKLDTRGGQEQVVLVVGPDPECEDTPRRNEDGCQSIGGFVVGNVSQISIIKSPTGAVFGTDDVPSKPNRGSSIEVGVEISLPYFPNFKKAVGDQPGITDFQANNSPLQIGVITEWGNSRFTVGLGARRGVHDFSQNYGASGEVAGKVRGDFVDAYIGLRALRSLQVSAGVTYAHNRLILVDPFSGEVLGAVRDHDGLMTNFSLSSDFWLGGGFGVRLRGGATTGWQRGSADDHLRGGVALIRRFGLGNND